MKAKIWSTSKNCKDDDGLKVAPKRGAKVESKELVIAVVVKVAVAIAVYYKVPYAISEADEVSV